MQSNTVSPPSKADQSDRALPLEGITVVSIEQAIAAPLASRYLGHLGARVIKIERPGSGDFARSYDTTVNGESSHFIWANANKESVELDLKSEFGIRAVEALLERADVFIQNLAPAAIDRLGLGPQALLERHPRLIVAGISGYGGRGPYRSAKAYDLLLQSETGLLSITGTEEAPSKAGIPVADIAAAMYTYSGILGALYERERTGKGQFVEVTLLDALTEWMGFPRYFTMYGGEAPERTGAYHAAIAPYGPYPSGDGEQVFLAVQNEREWLRFCSEVLGRPELSDDERFRSNADRSANRRELAEIIAGAFAGHTAAELLDRLDRADIANARARDVKGASAHPQLKARDRFRTLATPAGDVEAVRPPMLNDARETRMDPVPKLGEHTASVLNWLGLSQER